MPDTPRDRAYLTGTAFVDNTTGAITAQMLRDFAMSVPVAAANCGVVPTSKKTGAHNAAAGELVWCDTSGGTFQVTFPAAPATGDTIGVYVQPISGTTAVSAVDNSSGLCRITTGAAHGLSTNDYVAISGTGWGAVSPPINGEWKITVVDSTKFTLNGSTHSGAYVNNAAYYKIQPITVSGNGKNLDGSASQLLYAQEAMRVWRYDGTQWVTVAAYAAAPLANSYEMKPNTSGTFYDTGAQVVLPTKGFYVVNVDVRYAIVTSTGNTVSFEMAIRPADSGGTVIGDVSVRQLWYSHQEVSNRQGGSAYSFPVLASADNYVVKLQASLTGGATTNLTTALIASAANGRTVVSYTRRA